jgi:hypothetical protein
VPVRQQLDARERKDAAMWAERFGKKAAFEKALKLAALTGEDW